MRFSRVWPLLVLGSCALGSSLPDPQWFEHDLRTSPPVRDLLHASQFAVMRAGFPPGELDLPGKTLRSGWDERLSPFADRGRRSQATVQVVERADRSLQLRVRVEVQKNTESLQPLRAAAADWEPIAEDLMRARLVLEQILVRVAPRKGTLQSLRR